MIGNRYADDWPQVSGKTLRGTAAGMLAWPSRTLITAAVLLSGCGKSDSSNLRYATEVCTARMEELKPEDLTDIQTVVDRYRKCGYRVKALSDAGVNEKLSLAARRWAEADIQLANAIYTCSQIPNMNFAVLEGLLGLYAGQNPGLVGQRGLQRVESNNAAWTRVDIAFSDENATWADFSREMRSHLSSAENEILTGRVMQVADSRSSVQTSNTSNATHERGQSNAASDDPPPMPNHIVGRVVWAVRYHYGKVACLIVIALIVGIVSNYYEEKKRRK